MTDKKQITDFTGKTKLIGCLGCDQHNGVIENPSGFIFRTDDFGAHQDYEIPIPGFIIVDTKRHIQSIDEFTTEEKSNFMEFLIKIRKALREVLKIEIVYLVQEEDSSDHFHLWMFPRHQWMEKEFGRKIQSVRPIMEYARQNLKTKENIDKIRTANQNLKDYLN
jgi:diadenosine tetraphosphate (Ap4A) HIT family hydrolase